MVTVVVTVVVVRVTVHLTLGVTVGSVRADAVRGVRIVLLPFRAAWSVEELDLAVVEVVAQIEREVLGAQDLAGAVRRAMVGAAPALRARVEIQNRLPREVLDPADPTGSSSGSDFSAAAPTTSINFSLVAASGRSRPAA